jgi:XTP/dITP diphosphohydrolase
MTKDAALGNTLESFTRGSHPSRLVVATHNPGKLHEFRAMLAGCAEAITSAGELGLPEPEETGTTFAENALIKARAAALSGSLTLADDSGFCVNALGGRPGIYSARWALPPEALAKGGGPPSYAKAPEGQDKNFALAMKRVQDELGDARDRSAYFIAVLALVWPDGREELIEGRVDGQFIWPPRGMNGHGYDPVFVPNGETRSFAEMSDDEKNAISHRGIAVRKLMERFKA